MSIETQSLEAFVAISRLNSFSKAAQLLFLTQPAVSKRIQKLEQQLDARLFDRIGRKVVLTEAGRTLLPRASAILNLVNDTEHLLSRTSESVSGRLKIAISHHVGLHRLPPLLRRFREQYPEVAIEPQFMGSELACEAVENGDVELAVVTLPPAIDAKLLMIPIWHDPMVPVVSLQHPLLSHATLQLQQLTDYSAILPGKETITRQQIEALFLAEGAALRVDLSTNYLETIKMMVSVGLGWSVLPLTMVDVSLTVLPCEALTVHRQLGIIRHQERTQSQAGMKFCQLLSDENPGAPLCTS